MFIYLLCIARVVTATAVHNVPKQTLLRVLRAYRRKKKRKKTTDVFPLLPRIYLYLYASRDGGVIESNGNSRRVLK